MAAPCRAQPRPPPDTPSTAGFGYCSVVFGWDIHDCTYSKELGISNLKNGYKDILAKVDLASYRRLPGTPALPFFLVTFYDPETDRGLYACPRATLQKVVDDLASEGYEAFAGAEVRYPSCALSCPSKLTVTRSNDIV